MYVNTAGKILRDVLKTLLIIRLYYLLNNETFNMSLKARHHSSDVRRHPEVVNVFLIQP